MAYSSRKTMKKRPSGSKSKAPRKTMKKRASAPYRNVNLKKSIEKKVIDVKENSMVFAQSTSLASGHFEIGATPQPSQGLDANQRIGNRIYLTGARLDMEFQTQSATQEAFKYRWFLVRIPDCNSVATTDAITSDFLDPNVFNTTKYDWHSQTDHERSGGFRIVASGTGKLAPDPITAINPASRNQLRKYLRLGHEIKWDNSTSLVVTNQYRLILLGDSGNTATNTGAFCNYSIRYYFTDN